MKKVLLLVFAFVIVSAIMAVDFDYSGEFRTRAAMYNDVIEHDGGHIDGRFQLRLDSTLHPDLKLGAMFEIGNITWGDSGGNVGGGDSNIKTNELYIDYMIQALNAKLRVGRQYWADPSSLILDDNFNGIMLSMDEIMIFKAELAFIKANELLLEKKDDYNIFMAKLALKTPIEAGAMAMYGKDNVSKDANFTLMPYIVVELDPITFKAALFADYQSAPNMEDRIGFGGSIKAGVSLGMISAGVDLLYVNEEGLTMLSPYYQNGLYILGYGPCHDGVSLYWEDQYGIGNDAGFISLAGNAKISLTEQLSVMGAAGALLTDEDYIAGEVNAGIQYQVIPELFNISGYGALAVPEKGAEYNYLLGITGTVSF